MSDRAGHLYPQYPPSDGVPRHGGGIAGSLSHSGMMLAAGGLCVLLILCDTIISSYGFIVFGEESRVAFMGLAFLAVVLFSVMEIVEQDTFAVLFVGVLAVLLIAAAANFSFQSGVPFNPNVLAQYYALLAFVVFYELAKRDLLGFAFRAMVIIFTVYACIYVVLEPLYLAGYVHPFQSAKVYVTLHDTERGDRLFMHSGAVGFLNMYALVGLRRAASARRKLLFLLLLILSFSALFLSLSRIQIAATIMVALLYLAFRSGAPLRWVCLGVFAATSIYLMIGVPFAGWNPFDIDTNDTSTLYRRNEYVVMASWLRDNPILGVGLPESEIALTRLVGRLIFPADIGIVGTWFQFGMFGVILLSFLPAVICCFQKPLRRPVGGLGPMEQETLAVLGCSICALASMSTGMQSGPQALLFAMIAGLTLFKFRFSSGGAREPAGAARSEFADFDGPFLEPQPDPSEEPDEPPPPFRRR